MYKIYVFDVDGTLMDINHRRHFVEDVETRDFKAFFDAMDQDTPRSEIFDIAEALNTETNELIIVSGRNERHRELTEYQLQLLDYKQLILRPTTTTNQITCSSNQYLICLSKVI